MQMQEAVVKTYVNKSVHVFEKVFYEEGNEVHISDHPQRTKLCGLQTVLLPIYKKSQQDTFCTDDNTTPPPHTVDSKSSILTFIKIMCFYAAQQKRCQPQCSRDPEPCDVGQWATESLCHRRGRLPLPQLHKGYEQFPPGP